MMDVSDHLLSVMSAGSLDGCGLLAKAVRVQDFLIHVLIASHVFSLPR